MRWSLKTTKIPKNLTKLSEILLGNRDIKIDEDKFFNPKEPNDLSLKEVGIDEKNLKLVVNRIKKAKKNNEYIVIFGDYDADGICATAILWRTLFDMGCNVKPFIPNRKTHGYGISNKAIDEIIADKKPDLVISVDNGIVAYKPVAYLKNQGIDVIITDHHQPEMELGKAIFPNADFVVHSTKLCGATVAWMLSREIIKNEEKTNQLLDLCAIATIADQVPLLEANRSFAKYGIEAIKKNKRVGLKLLLEATIKNIKSVNSDTIGFIIAPRINAMGRLADGIVALRFLCTKSELQAKKLLSVLLTTNDQRKNLTHQLLLHAQKQIEILKDEHILIVHSNHYHEGILGLIAGSLLEKYNKPVIAISVGDNFAKASARSINGVNIVDLLREIKGDLLEVGGHPMAAGFGFKSQYLETIKLKLFKLAKENISTDKLIKQLESECVLPADLIKDELVDLINKFRPFGQGNTKPIFEIRDLKIVEATPLGNKGTHLKLILKHAQNTGIKAIGWRMGDRADDLKKGDNISIVASLEFNVWQDRRSIQMTIKDIKKV